MNTDVAVDLTNGQNVQLLLKEKTEKIIGCAFDVINETGHGFHEKIYENALTVAFRLKGIPFQQQKSFPVFFRDHRVGEFIPDLIVFDSVVLDPKCIDRITGHERGQMLNYLHIARMRVGLILNFRYARLQWERLVR